MKYDYSRKYKLLLYFLKIKLINSCSNIVPEEDFPHYKSSQQEKNLRYKPRKINHPKFKNTSSQGAMEYLSDKENGDVMNLMWVEFMIWTKIIYIS